MNSYRLNPLYPLPNQSQVLPDTAAFLKAEAERARRHGWIEEDGGVNSFDAVFERKIVAAAVEVRKQVYKYKIAPKTSKGQLFLNLQDPSIAPSTARALLKTLK